MKKKEVLLEELPKEDLQVLVAIMDDAYQKGYYDAMNREMICWNKEQEVEE